MSTITGPISRTFKKTPVAADSSVDSVAGLVAARTLAAEVTWATAALWLPGTSLGMTSHMSNTTLPAEEEEYGISTQVGS